MLRSGLLRSKQIVKKGMIAAGLIKPGQSGRHGWVGPAQHAQMKRQFQIDFLKGKGLLPKHQLLDWGCGTLRGGIPLIDYLDSGHYIGVDVREEVLKEARKELAEQGLAQKHPQILHTTDLKEKPFTVQFNFIWAFNVFIHMTDSIFQEALGFMAQQLQSDGFLYGTVYLGGRGQDREWQGFPAVTRPLLFYEDLSASAGVDLNVLGTLDRLGYGAQNGERSQLVMMEWKAKA